MLDTQNFERVLAGLNAAIRMSEVLGLDPGALLRAVRSVKSALAAAVRGVHVTRSDVADETLAEFRTPGRTREAGVGFRHQL